MFTNEYFLTEIYANIHTTLHYTTPLVVIHRGVEIRPRIKNIAYIIHTSTPPRKTVSFKECVK